MVFGFGASAQIKRLAGAKNRVFGGRQDDSEQGRSKGGRPHHRLLLPRGDGWRWLMWLLVFDHCFRERSTSMGWRDKQKGGPRRGQPRGYAFAVHAVLFLLLSPVPVCQAVSCTTKIRDLVTSQPGITKIDKNVCNEGEVCKRWICNRPTYTAVQQPYQAHADRLTGQLSLADRSI